MREDILISVILLSFAASYVLVYQSLHLAEAYSRVLATGFFTVLFSIVLLVMYTGYIRPFYTAYILMIFYIVLQRLYLVRSSPINGSEVS